MLAPPSVRATVSSNPCRIPGTPAVPKKSAYSDHAVAARTPTEIRVSIVVAPWRRFVHAALWNGHAHHTTTGPASARTSHCQYVNCNAGTIDNAITGTDSATDVTNRCRSESPGVSGSVSTCGSSAV